MSEETTAAERPHRQPIVARAREPEGPAPLPALGLTRGTVIGDRYTMVGSLGHGGMGDVFRVRHRTLGKEFALKMISASFAENARARALFEREAKLASSLAHANIVSVVDFGEDLVHGAYMVMELIDGTPLLDRIGERPLPLRLACELIAQVADALRYIHDHEIIHGDIKAGNVLLVSEQTVEGRRTRAALLDFGLARPRQVAKTSITVDGTPDYMAPERILGAAASVRTDIYSLGVLLYQMLTGVTPFGGSVEQVLLAQVSEPAPSPSLVRGEALDERLEALVLRALAKSPDERHPHAGAFLYELRTAMEMMGLSQRRRQRAKRASTGESPRLVAAAAAFDASATPMAVVSDDGVIIAANAAYLRLAAQGAAVEGTHVGAGLLGERCPELLATLAEVVATGEPETCWLRELGRAPGDEVHLIPGGNGLVHLTILPVTERD